MVTLIYKCSVQHHLACLWVGTMSTSSPAHQKWTDTTWHVKQCGCPMFVVWECKPVSGLRPRKISAALWATWLGKQRKFTSLHYSQKNHCYSNDPEHKMLFYTVKQLTNDW